MLDLQDHELVNTKQVCEALGVINVILISDNHHYYARNAYPIPQTIAGVEIEVDSEEFQEWYQAFTTFPSQAISEGQYQINAVINKYTEGGNRTNRQKQHRSEDYTSESTFQCEVKSPLATVRQISKSICFNP